MPHSRSVALLCPACGARLQATDLEPRCGACGARVTLRSGTGFEDGRELDRCAVCGSEALHRAKDFNRAFGVVLVALGCIGFAWGALAGIASLAALTIADRIVYHLRPEVTVCYACKSVYRGLPLHPRLLAYELTYDETFEGTGEKPHFEPGAHKPL